MQEKSKLARAVPKDTGWAWMCVLGTAMIQCLVLGGCVDSFGVLYAAIQNKFDASATQVAWIPATLTFCAFITATPANLLCSWIGTRRVVVIGSILMNTGFALSAFAHKIWMMYVTYGLLAGVGAGLNYAPSIVIIGTYFEKRRAVAYGIIFASASVGSFVCPPVIKYVLDSYGLEGTLLLMGGAMFHAAIAGMFFRPPQFYLARHLMRERLCQNATTFQSQESTQIDTIAQAKSINENSCRCGECSIAFEPENSSGHAEIIHANTCCDNGSTPVADSIVEESKKPTSQWNILKHPLLYLYTVTYSLSDTGYHNSFTMIPQHANEIGIIDYRAVFLLSISGISGGVSRLLTGWLGDFNLLGNKHVYLVSVAFCGIALCVFPLVDQFAHMAVLCAVSGVTAGSINVLVPVLLADELGVSYTPVTYGVLYGTSAFFFLVFPVITGYLRDLTGRWNDSFLVSGSLAMLGAIIILAEPCALKHGRKKMDQI